MATRPSITRTEGTPMKIKALSPPHMACTCPACLEYHERKPGIDINFSAFSPLRVWGIKRIYDAICENPYFFQDTDAAAMALGVSRNAVDSCIHWMVACQFLGTPSLFGVHPEMHTLKQRYPLQPTPLADAILGDNGLDPFLENDGTLWVIHHHLTQTPRSLMTYYVFNHFIPSNPRFTKETLIQYFRSYVFNTLQAPTEKQESNFKYKTGVFSYKSLSRHINAFLRMYIEPEDANLEGLLANPLWYLNILQRQGEDTFIFNESEIPVEMFAYCLLSFWEASFPHTKAVDFKSLYMPSSPLVIFKLSENATVAHLESLENITDGNLQYRVSANLRQVYKKRNITAMDMLSKYYQR